MILQYLLVLYIFLNKWTTSQNLQPDCNIANSSFSCVDGHSKQLYEKCFTTKFCTKTDNFDPETLPQCPRGFTDASDFCYVVTKKSAFPPKCPFPNVVTTPFEDYKFLITKDNLGPVWIPVQRNVTNGLGFLQWVEHSRNYKTEYRGHYTYEGHLKGKDCLLYNNSKVVAVSCKEQHAGLCVYEKVHNARNALCGGEQNCAEITQRAEPKCVCAVSSLDANFYPKAEFLDPHENNIYELVAKDKNCTISLEKTANGRFVWTTSGREIDYSFWRPNATFEDGSSFVASSGVGWILTKQSASCTLFEKNVRRHFLSLHLGGPYDGVFILNVVNSGLEDISPMVFCFTDANSTSLLYRYTDDELTSTNTTSTTYQFKPFENVSGHYWCESFTYPDSETVTSNVIFVRGSSYYPDRSVVTYNLHYGENINPLSSDIITEITPVAASTGCLYQIIKILDLNETTQEVLIRVLYSCVIQVEYPPPSNGDIVSIQEVDSCARIVENNATWRETNAGYQASPLEFCFTNKGYNFVRTCVEDSFSGSYWTEGNCKIPEKSVYSKRLLEIGQTDSFEYRISEMKLSSTNYWHFNAYDIFLVATDLGNFTLQCDMLGDLTDIMDNILKIDNNVMIESQQKMHALDIWTNVTNQIQDLCMEREAPYQYIKTNFEYIVSSTTAFCRETVDVEGVKRAVFLLHLTSLHDVLKSDRIQSAVWMDPSNEHSDVRKAMKYYVKPTFFFDKTMLGNISYVYELNATTSDEVPVWLLQRFDATFTSNRKVKCASWKYGNVIQQMEGSWIVDGELEITNSHFICKFKRMGTFTIILTPEVNVRDSLTEILVSNSTSSEILSRLAQVTSKTDDIVSTDVFLIGQILKKLGTRQDVDLDVLGDTINNLHNFDKRVLETSQNEGKATDSILESIDVILQNYKCQGQCLVKKDKFTTLIYNAEETFSAFVLLDSGEVEILREATPSDLTNYKNFDSAVVISPELRSQLDNDKVIISVFRNDVLFNEKTETRYRVEGKVYSVILPEILANYSGPLSIIQKAKTNNPEQECSYWSYNATQSGFWKSYATATVHSSLVQCDFFHTTHFGVLLLEDTYEDTPLLDFITVTCCILSLFGYASLILTAILYKSWRKKGENKFLLNFAFSGLFQTLVFYVSTHKKYLTNRFVCVFTGVVLHYSVLVQFCWMFIIAHLQYKKLILKSNTQTTYLLLKANLVTWGLPLTVILSVFGAHGENYANSKVGICYPTGVALYLGVWWPVSVVVANNFVTYLFIVDTILNTKDSSRRHGSDDTYYHVLRIASMFFFLGLTWIFGFLAELSHSAIFIYLFDALATLQGFVLFLIYVVFDKNVKELYLSKVVKSKQRRETDVLMPLSEGKS